VAYLKMPKNALVSINEMHDGLKVSPKNRGLKGDLKHKIPVVREMLNMVAD
jgi:hypothetical protein